MSEFPQVTFHGSATEEQKEDFLNALTFVDLYAGEFARPPFLAVYVDSREDDQAVLPGFRSLMVPLTDATIYESVGSAFEKRHLAKNEVWFRALTQVYFLEHIYQDVPQMRKVLATFLGGSRVRDLDSFDRNRIGGLRDFLPSFEGGAPWYDRDRWGLARTNLRYLPAFVKSHVDDLVWHKSNSFWLLTWLVPILDLYADLVEHAITGESNTLDQLITGYEDDRSSHSLIRRSLHHILTVDPELEHYAPELLVQDMIAEMQHHLTQSKRFSPNTYEAVLDTALMKRMLTWNSKNIEVSP